MSTNSICNLRKQDNRRLRFCKLTLLQADYWEDVPSQLPFTYMFKKDPVVQYGQRHGFKVASHIFRKKHVACPAFPATSSACCMRAGH